jgi:TetR/AcrR family transcriptional regulator
MTDPSKRKPSQRKAEILHVLAGMLEAQPGTRLTTAKLAEAVNVSEAALYRHFPSKAKMYEALMEFAEASVFERISIILATTQDPFERSEQIVSLVLTFCEKNPGITRLMTGEPLAGESPRLRQRAGLFFERIETQLRQIFRETHLTPDQELSLNPSEAASLLSSLLEGKVIQFVRSDFKLSPTLELPNQISRVLQALKASPPAAPAP